MNRRGSLLFETALITLLLAGLLYGGHVEVIRRWQKRVRSLNEERLRYDGAIQWKP